jgi:hypothetical protein
MSERKSGDLSVRVAGAFLPTVVTANLLGVWLAKPVAWAMSILTWNLAIYWISPRPTMSFNRWLVIVVVTAIVSAVVAVFQPTIL